MAELSEKRSKPITSIDEALEALFDIWDTVGQEKKKTEQILSYINEVLDRDITASDKADAYYIRGTLYFKQNRYSEAEEDLKKALWLDGKLRGARMCANAHDWLAWICNERGETENAIKWCEDGIRRLQTFYNSHNVTDLFYTLAELHIQHKDVIPSALDKALLYFYQGLENDRNFPHYKSGDALFNLGYLREGIEPLLYDPQKAIEWYECFLHLTSDDDPYYRDERQYARKALERLKREEGYQGTGKIH